MQPVNRCDRDSQGEALCDQPIAVMDSRGEALVRPAYRCDEDALKFTSHGAITHENGQTDLNFWRKVGSPPPKVCVLSSLMERC